LGFGKPFPAWAVGAITTVLEAIVPVSFARSRDALQMSVNHNVRLQMYGWAIPGWTNGVRIIVPEVTVRNHTVRVYKDDLFFLEYK
jgi:hypothetical protein